MLSTPAVGRSLLLLFARDGIQREVAPPAPVGWPAGKQSRSGAGKPGPPSHADKRRKIMETKRHDSRLKRFVRSWLSSWPLQSPSIVLRGILWGRRHQALQSDTLFADVLPFDQTFCSIYLPVVVIFYTYVPLTKQLGQKKKNTLRAKIF